MPFKDKEIKELQKEEEERVKAYLRYCPFFL
jgi:predicted HicB family RNase H-like nuclease